MRICFVCLGNICRSPMAEMVLRELAKRRGLRIEASSRGTSGEELGNPVYPPARAELARRGIPCSAHTATQLTRADYDAFDLFVGMDERNVSAMRRLFGGDPQRKVAKLLSFRGEDRDVADPWYTRDFAAAFSDIFAGVDALLASLFPPDPKR